MTSRLERLTAEMRAELVRGILPYWMTSAVDERRGGFIGAITEAEERQPDAPKGGILAARILWTFAAAYRVLGDARYRDMARVAFEQLRARFLDAEHGGLHWMLHADGAVADDRKHVYAQAFAIYGLAEYARATGDLDARHEAIALFRLVELKARDLHHGGYVEAFARDWTPLDDVRLGETDPDYPKSTNTHLHVLEAYANLYRAWQHPSVRDSLAALLHVFLDHL
ncbi:MAG TPA: AGE family epimerase/isomerase, partial [Gemmatimonadaceae bacterium]|nr:AGE family epimerase/isomerase [Gemmatimonadaceae bacterium]